MNLLWYNRPASVWEGALPLGNGRFGAMIYGGVQNECFQINDITLWSGGPTDGGDRSDAYTYLEEIRRLVRAKDFAAAQEMIVAHFTETPYFLLVFAASIVIRSFVSSRFLRPRS